MDTLSPDALRIENRDRIPAQFVYLLEKFPRDAWPKDTGYNGLASFWVEHHNWFRELGGQLQDATKGYREKPQDPAVFRRFLIPRLQAFLNNLNAHHQIEDANYFPTFRALDDRMLPGMDLLEQDHETIHAVLLANAEAGQAFSEALAKGGDASRFAADAYADSADKLLDYLLRHLRDEEDLLIPAILDRGGSLPGLY